MKTFPIMTAGSAALAAAVLCSCAIIKVTVHTTPPAPKKIAKPTKSGPAPFTQRAVLKPKDKFDAGFATNSIIVEVGSELTITAPVVPNSLILAADQNKPIGHYWIKDGETNLGSGNLTLSNMTAADAGEYTAVYTGAVEIVTVPVYVSVISYFTNQSNGGALAVPIGNFSSQTGAKVCPGAESSVNMNKFAVYWPFDGPNSQSPSAVFPNISNEANLLVSTCTNANPAPLDTAVQIVQNFGNADVVACDDNSPPDCSNNTKLSSCVAIGLANNSQYRVAIYYRSQTKPAGLNAVTFRWKYSNGTTW